MPNRRPIIRKYLTPILMEKIAWHLMRHATVRDIARLEQVSTDTVYRVVKLAPFQNVMDKVKGQAFAKVEANTQDSIGLAQQKFVDAAPDIADRLIKLAKDTHAPQAVQHAAGLTCINKAGVAARERAASTEPVLTEKIIDLVRQTDAEIFSAEDDRPLTAIPS